jgi:hypothetical protein
VQTFKEILRPGESKAFVTWKEPNPNCEVTLESSNSTAPDGLFTVGKHTRQYTYRHKTGFSMTCDVNIEVEGTVCLVTCRASFRIYMSKFPPVSMPTGPMFTLHQVSEIITKIFLVHRRGSSKVGSSVPAYYSATYDNFKHLLFEIRLETLITRWYRLVTLSDIKGEGASSPLAPSSLVVWRKLNNVYTVSLTYHFFHLACECPTQTVNGVIGPSRTQGLASWEIPEPTCPAHPKQPIPEPQGSFTKGEHTVQYVYTHKSASNTFDITCDVNINMEGTY